VPKPFCVSLNCIVAALLIGSPGVFAQTPAGDIARGQGAYLKGLGTFNLNTAQANSINVDATIRWKEDLRRIQREKWELDARRLSGKKLKLEDVQQQQRERERKLRVDPTSSDVEKGDALNVLLYDLTDPSIKQSDWSSKAVSLPPGTSVKDLVFRFTPQSGSSKTSAALSKGVIALSRLDIKGRWPTFMEIPALEAEKTAYENAYAKVRDRLLAGQFDLKAVLEMDRTLDALKSKVTSSVPAERDYRTQALKFVDDLRDSTLLFDAETVDYAKDILNDTRDHDATTVAELVSFMLKYRLQFASAERSPSARELYPRIYQALREQADKLEINSPESHGAVSRPLFNGSDLSGWNYVPNDASRSKTLSSWTVDSKRHSLVCDGKDQNELETNSEYQDFNLTFDWRWLPNSPTSGNGSGVAIRSRGLTAKRLDPRGIEIDLRPEIGDAVVGTSRRKQLLGPGTLIGYETPLTNTNYKVDGFSDRILGVLRKPVLKAAGEWNKCEINCQGKELTVAINGQVVNEVFDIEVTKGRIVLRNQGAGIEFRSIMIKELP
jgi:hypothetical protein